MIGDTAAISLLTGLPGAGKSLRLAQAIVTLVEKGTHVYHCNIDGLNVPGTTPWADPHKWEELPPGAVLFVDEAQQFFPARRGGDPAPTVSRMSTIRHEGVRLVLATQQPNYLDTYLRGLVGYHEHLLRRSGKEASFIFRNSQIIEEVRAALPRIKKLYDYENWAFPKKYFAAYRSAQLHTVKYQMPALVKKALMIIPAVVLMSGIAWATVFRDSSLAEPETPEEGGVLDAAASGVPARTNGKQPPITTPEDYARQFTPMIDGLPWSAPAFVDRPIKADPHAYCMTSAPGQMENGEYKGETFSCVSEQGTRVLMQRENAAHLARWGEPYNPFKGASGQRGDERQRQDNNKADGVQGLSPAAMARSAVPPPATVIGGDQVSGYGDMGARQITPATGGTVEM